MPRISYLDSDINGEEEGVLDLDFELDRYLEDGYEEDEYNSEQFPVKNREADIITNFIFGEELYYLNKFNLPEKGILVEISGSYGIYTSADVKLRLRIIEGDEYDSRSNSMEIEIDSLKVFRTKNDLIKHMERFIEIARNL